MNDDQKQILKLAASIATMDLDELVEGHRRRLLILDSQIEALRQEREALAEERRKLRAEREQLHALYKINVRVLNIVNNAPNKTGEQKCQRSKGESDSSRTHTLKEFARRTH